MRRRSALISMKLRIWLRFGLALGAPGVTGGGVWAHGERAEEGFLRMETVAFSDVTFSTQVVRQGEQVTITGQATVLETWPKSLPGPSVGYVNVDAPGPVILMQDRLINGVEQPARYFFTK